MASSHEAWADDVEKGRPAPSPSVELPPRKTGLAQFMNKGFLSNLFTFSIMLVGIVVELQLPPELRKYNYVLAFGLFGFAGGITNWLAIKMLFDRVPGLYGSGVIPMRFREIRETVKSTIMKTFFDEAYLQAYIAEKGPQMAAKLDLGDKVAGYVARPEFDEQLISKLEELSTKPENQMLLMMKSMMPFQMMVPMMKPVLQTLAKDMVGAGVSDMASNIEVGAVRDELEQLMTDKLKLLTPEIVKRLMEEVIREHLGWLIIWGNVFGGLIGVITLTVRLAG